MSDEAALLEKLEKVMDESRKLRVRLALLQRQVSFYPLLANPGSKAEPLPEPAPSAQIAKSTFARPKTEPGGDGILAGLRTVPPNPEPVRLLREIPALPIQAQSRDEALRGEVDQPELVTALAVGV